MIGERLQELRKDKKISQEELGRIIGVSHYTISSYECNRSDPDDKTKRKIAELFDVSVDYLLGLIDEPIDYKRQQRALDIPKEFSLQDIEEIQQYIKFLKFKKEQKE